MGSRIGHVPDTTPCICFLGFQICYWVRFFPGVEFISFAVVIISTAFFLDIVLRHFPHM